MNLALILVIATLVTGLVWALDRLWLIRLRSDDADEPTVVEWCRAFFPVLLIVLVLRSFIAEPFRIPSASMMPTLVVGDFILVNKFAYGLRLPVLETKILDLGQPERGEVAVFRYPPNPSKDYIKRVIGVPGDHVAYRNNTLYINGEAVNQQVMGEYEPREVDRRRDRVLDGSILMEETLGAQDYEILVSPRASGMPSQELEQGIRVPEGEYLMLGDNRDNSLDGRHWGFVPEDHLRGRAMVIWLSWEAFGAAPQWGRVGQVIR
ncbi:signal peptidase I [Natronospira proteinivora]|uniref:Signal peptidase I n=1 Tax=Natronospira proteinivora TaxID=1807133 RepID=A0ABT1G5V4_9GAMM|nr:signal peptidase I [Natronospira proteinivora]MCP1726675.1 signal peptidase I [Natronospira proteinivora]